MPVRVDRTEQIEKALANVYLALFKEIKKDANYPADITFLKNQYNRKVYDASRKAISEVYNEGSNYVGTRLRVETYPSRTDITNITQETDKALNLFWTRLTADATREREIQQQQNRIVATQERTKQSFDTEFYLTNAALITTTGALAISTLSKTDQLVKDPELDVKRPTITWTTQMDEKVCPICNALDGQTWPYDDPEIPVPGRNGPNGTHSNCRCFLSLE